jgi:glyoxylase-like metal-dependent hydrolase (beta-lactamase superfamily II)
LIELGEIRVHVLQGGRFALDGGAVFGVVPRALWERAHPPDERNRVRLACNLALVETGGQRVLIDTGLGDKWTDKQREIYCVERGAGVLEALAGLGLGPDDIDVVVNTHLHFDHAGGNTRLRDGRAVPSFPRARYVVQLGEWEDATRPHERSHASYLEENFVPLAEARQLETVQGEQEVAAGVRVVPVGGHTAYHQLVLIEGGGRTLALPTDLLATAAHLPLAWLMAYDLFPLGTLAAKRKLLKEAAENDWLLLLYHDPAAPLARVREEKGRYLMSEVKP